MISRVTPEMSHKSWIYGTPQKAAAELQAFIDADVTWVATVDILPALLDADSSAAALQRSIFAVAEDPGHVRSNPLELRELVGTASVQFGDATHTDADSPRDRRSSDR